MPSFATRTVSSLVDERTGIQRVVLDDGSRAYSLTDLTGSVAVGDEVIVNTTAVELGLGTGGWHVVHWNLSRREWHGAAAGHVMKLRYTSLQVDVGAAEELDASLSGREMPELAGLPVVACSLHSQLAPIALALQELAPRCRLVYVMSDTAALPAALSDAAAALIDGGFLAGVISAGQAFGGDLEAVNVLSGVVMASQRLDADVVVVAPGPGIVGTSTRLGNSAVEVAAHVDLLDRIGARTAVAVRHSGADTRPRHRGVSHHTLTALRLIRADVDVPIASGPHTLAAAEEIGSTGHPAMVVECPDVVSAGASYGISLSTMGRSPAEDPSFFAMAGAAGAWAAGRTTARQATVRP